MLEIDYETNVDIGYREITAALPHRHPFLLLDKVVYVDVEDDTIVAKKNVTANEAFFQGHFPEAPIMPGVLILEALAQTGAFLVHQKGYVPENKLAVLLSIDKAKFRQAVHPGDTLTLYG
jgi:3-hydroxyacyl-[acyl-carrier-protein] dehydratase